MSYDAKLDLADLCAFGPLCAISGPSEKLKRGGCRLRHKHQWGMYISMQRKYTEGLVQDSLRGPAEPSCCVRRLQVFSTLNDALNHTILTLQYAKCLENVSMEMWERPGRQHGADVRARSKIEQTCEQRALG